MNFVENYPKKSHLLKNSAFAEVYMKRNFKYSPCNVGIHLSIIFQHLKMCIDGGKVQSTIELLLVLVVFYEGVIAKGGERNSQLIGITRSL